MLYEISTIYHWDLACNPTHFEMYINGAVTSWQSAEMSNYCMYKFKSLYTVPFKIFIVGVFQFNLASMAGKVMSILSHNWATSHYEAMCVVIFLQFSDFPLIKKLKISASVGPIPAEWTLFTFVAKMQFVPCCVSARTCFFFFSTKNCPFELHQPSSCCVLRFTTAVCWIIMSEFQVGDSSF